MKAKQGRTTIARNTVFDDGFVSSEITGVSRLLVVLGPFDPEMYAIKRFLNKQGVSYVMARGNSGALVQPFDMYNVAVTWDMDMYDRLVFVECSLSSDHELTKHPLFVSSIEIDHHMKHNPAYYMGYDEYMRASAIGQVCTLFDCVMPKEDRIIAALDHCQYQAILGLCPGVSAHDAIARSCAETARSLCVSVRHVQNSIALFQRILRWNVRDVFVKNHKISYYDQSIDPGYSLQHLAMQAACGLEGLSVMVRSPFVLDGESYWKLFCNNVSPDFVATFLSDMIDERDVQRRFGCEKRGYCGGFILQKEDFPFQFAQKS